MKFLLKFCRLKTQEELRLDRQKFFLTLSRTSVFVLFISSTDWITTTYSKEGNLLLSGHHLNVNLIRGKKKTTLTETTRISECPKAQSHGQTKLTITVDIFVLFLKAFSLSTLSIILPVGFSYVPFIQEVLFCFYLAKRFYPERDRKSCTLSTAFSVFIEVIV